MGSDALEPGADSGERAEEVGVLMGSFLESVSFFGVPVFATSLLGLLLASLISSASSRDGEGRLVGTVLFV